MSKYYASLLLVNGGNFVLIALLISIEMKFVLTRTTFSLLFVFLALFALAAMTFGVAFSPFFKNPRIASIVVGVGFFMTLFVKVRRRLTVRVRGRARARARVRVRVRVREREEDEEQAEGGAREHELHLDGDEQRDEHEVCAVDDEQAGVVLAHLVRVRVRVSWRSTCSPS